MAHQVSELSALFLDFKINAINPKVEPRTLVSDA